MVVTAVVIIIALSAAVIIVMAPVMMAQEGEVTEITRRKRFKEPRKLFRNSNMTEANWKILGDMLNKIIQDCMGEALYNGLVEVFNGGTIAIQFVEGATGSFGSISEDNKDTGIKLGMQMESNQLLHEMFHAY